MIYFNYYPVTLKLGTWILLVYLIYDISCFESYSNVFLFCMPSYVYEI